jgi:hypothetical protein
MYFRFPVIFLRRLAVGALIAWPIWAAGVALGAQPPSAVLSFKTQVVASGDSTDASIKYDDRGVALSVIQFDVEHDPSVHGLTATAGDGAVKAGKFFIATPLQNGNLRILIFGLDQKVVSAGALVNLHIQVSPVAPPGSSSKLSFTNIVGSGVTGEPISVAAQEGQITVIRGH